MIRSLLNITDISTFAMAVTACAQLILSAAVASVALYLYFQNRTVRAVGYYTASTVALFGWNLFYAINYLFADSVVAAASLRLAAEGCMITYLMILIYYVGEVITGEEHTTFNLNRASKVIFAVFWLIFGARGVIYPEGGEDPTAYIRLVRLFRFPVAIFIIAVVIYIIRMLFEWKTRIRFKRSLSVYWMFGNFCAVAVVAALLDIVFPIGGLIDTFQFSALAGTLSSPLLAVIAVSYLNTRVSVENASRLLRGEIPTPLFTVNGESDRIAVANDAAMRFLGKTREELIGHTLSEFFDTEIDEKTIIRRSLGEAKYYFDKGTVRGTKIPCSFVANNIHDRFGEPFCCLIFVYDKSNEEEMIERLRESALSAERANSARGMFLANMSHEIRTPMNAIIGMAEIGLREAEKPQVQEELRQIRAAGNGLLEIINDILDFSKIESGTLEIVNAGFEPLSMINDLVNIVRQKLHDKKLEFIVKVNPRFPSGVLGDEGRIKQVLLNILNNAVKYTDEGCVQLTVDFENQDNGILMQVEIRDSGIGIKEEEQANLFKSYNQLDVYKNRNKEGTGLGLSISKRLVDMMDGAINVSSIYGQGSTFSITIPLEVTDYAESISVNKAEQLKTATFLKPSSSEETFRQLLKDIGISGDIQCTYPPDVLKAVKNGAKYIFIDEEFLNSELLGISGAYQDVKVAVITNDPEKYEDKPYISMQRPEFGLRLMSIFGEEKTDEHRASTGSYRYDFKAPGARVLIVDDNAVNLSVAEGLLKPFEIQVDTVLSGEEAVKQVVDVRYDIVFMDHMMPGMDGVAATRHIREELGDKELIIIALTANAIRGTDKLLKQVGMNDFIAKPIDMNDMASKLKKWLPAEKIIAADTTVGEVRTDIPEILRRLDPKDIDIEQGLTYTGGDPDTYIFTIKIYREEIENNIALMEKALAQNDIRDFTIRIHALKSASRSIGASQLAEDALKLEMSGKNDDADFIKKNAPAALKRYREYLGILGDFAEDEEEEDNQAKEAPLTLDEFEESLMTIRTAVNDFDIDVALETINWIKKHRMRNDSDEKFISDLLTYVEDLEYDDSILLIDRYFKEAGNKR